MEDLSWENSIKLMLSFGSFLAEFINSLDHSTSQGWDEQRIREKPELHLLIFFSRWVGNKSFGSVKKKQKNKNKNKKKQYSVFANSFIQITFDSLNISELKYS